MTRPSFEATAVKGYPDRPAGFLVRLVRPAFEVRLSEGFGDPMVACGGQVVSRAGQSRRGPEQSSERAGEDLDVHAVTFAFPE